MNSKPNRKSLASFPPTPRNLPEASFALEATPPSRHGTTTWLTVREAAVHLRCSSSYIRKAIHLKLLKAADIALEGSRCEWRISQRDLDAFMDSRLERRA
jgi:excisionase family DNA binding protein